MTSTLIAFYTKTNLVFFNVLTGYLLAHFMCRAFLTPWNITGKAMIIFTSFAFSTHIFASTYFFSEQTLRIWMAIGFSTLPYPTAALLFSLRKRSH